MVSVQSSVYYCHCILLIAMSSSWQSCETAGEYVELSIRTGSKYERKSCDLFSWENAEVFDIHEKEASSGCYCQLLLTKEGTLSITDLHFQGNREAKSYDAIAEGSWQFIFGVSTKRPHNIYVKQGGHTHHWDYRFSNGIRFNTDASFKWLNCTAVSQMNITNLANPPITSTTTMTTNDLPLEPFTSTTSTTMRTIIYLPPDPITSTTQSSLPVSEKPRQSHKKFIVIGVVIGVVLFLVIVPAVVFFICCFVRKRRLKSPKEVSKAPYMAVSANDRTQMGPIYQNSATASVNNIGTHDQSVDQVEYAEIKPDSLVPRTDPNGQDQAPPSGEASKPLVYADLAFHASPTAAGNGEKVETATETVGSGMTEDQLNQLYAKPMKRKK